MKRALISLSVVGVLAAGCSSHNSAAKTPQRPATASPSTSATTAASPTAGSSAAGSSAAPAAWSIQVAAAKYSAIVAPVNAATRTFLNDNSNSVSYPAAAQEAATVAADFDVFARALIAGNWPAGVAPTAQKLADEVLAARTYWEAMGKMTSASDIQAASNDSAFVAAENTSTATATRMRILLGLPSN